MRLFALTFGSAGAASTEYRLFQYRDFFAAAGIEFVHAEAKGFADFSALAKYDVVLLQKTLLAGGKVKQIRQYSRRLLYDADDLIWLSPQKRHNWFTRLRIESRLRKIATLADLCLAANAVIAADLVLRGAVPEIVPMALDGRKWCELPKKSDGPVTVGWSGSPKNLPFLRQILPAMKMVQQKYPAVRWAFHCGENPALEGLRYEHLPYAPNAEPDAVRQFDIGLLPLPDDPFVRGKSPIKALQYFACRAAVVASPVGASREVLRDGDNSLWATGDASQWAGALERLITDRDLRHRIAAAGRLAFERQFEARVVFGQLRRALEGK